MIVKFHYLLLLFLPYWQTTSSDPVDKIAALIKEVDMPELSKMMAPSVELAILQDESIYPKAQAIAALKNFLNTHQPVTVKVLHRISSNPNYRFAVLIVTTKNGAYRTTISLKRAGGLFTLNELRIEAEKTK